MKEVQLSRRQVLKGAGAIGVLGALSPPTNVFADGTTVRWDIISVDFTTGTISAGGLASADANDGSKITLTGSGTFSPEDDNVTGGGEWQTFAPAPVGSLTGSGTYRVTGLVSWIQAPGTPPLPNDTIGNLADSHGGLAILRVAYSDGSRGVLTVSCHIVGTPDSVFEGVTTTKGFVDYWNREAPPAPPTNGNRTNFHVMSEDDQQGG
jgi:hypothetical protein